MASLSFRNALNLFFLMAFAAALMLSPTLAVEFLVGGSRGWAMPAANETGMYNDWAAKHRFHVGDSLYFKYKVEDSVLVVKHEDYVQCKAPKPLLRFAQGETEFRFDRFGFFYFISGDEEHCKSGQKLIVRVMVHPEFPAPASSPEISNRGEDGGLSAPGSSAIAKSAAAAALKFSPGSSALVVGMHGVLGLLLSLI